MLTREQQQNNRTVNKAQEITPWVRVTFSNCSLTLKTFYRVLEHIGETFLLFGPGSHYTNLDAVVTGLMKRVFGREEREK